MINLEKKNEPTNPHGDACGAERLRELVAQAITNERMELDRKSGHWISREKAYFAHIVLNSIAYALNPYIGQEELPGEKCPACEGLKIRKCSGCPHDSEQEDWCRARRVIDCPPCPACGGKGVKP